MVGANPARLYSDILLTEESSDVVASTDASGVHGGGGWSPHEKEHWTVKWTAREREMPVPALEAYAVLIALLTWSQRWVGKVVRIEVDCYPVEGMWRKRYSSSP